MRWMLYPFKTAMVDLSKNSSFSSKCKNVSAAETDYELIKYFTANMFYRQPTFWRFSIKTKSKPLSKMLFCVSWTIRNLQIQRNPYNAFVNP